MIAIMDSVLDVIVQISQVVGQTRSLIDNFQTLHGMKKEVGIMTIFVLLHFVCKRIVAYYKRRKAVR
ncbi:hypothetical protein QR680_018402 [Steinernema hermaphroditum]|uniref:Uncharacterized protein n=1 Tax=Steinernema hermaphroditum TaxID=289476 RepID=A0AA39LQZ0_9BILA|nr:hypothetical protein QR680_018402 [Steinernema hermaphroditum]